MAGVLYEFEWDIDKAESNLRKHGVSFVLGTSIFRDPLAATIFDDEHRDDGDRWVTVGRARNERVVVVVHTWEPIAPDRVCVRIISARIANRRERQRYENEPA